MTTRSIQSTPPTPSWWRNIATSSPFFPEGISTFLLMVGLVACGSLAVQEAGWNDLTVPVVYIGLASAAFGGLLAKFRILDTVAHMLGISIGIAASLGAVAVNAPEMGDNLRSRIRPLLEIIGRWYVGSGRNEDQERYLVSLLLCVITWLVGYLSAWILFRRGWIAIAIGLPGFLLLTTLAYAPDPDRRYLAIFALIAIPLLARFSLFVREREWRRMRVQPMRSLAPTVLTIGAVIGLISTAAGWQSGGNISQAAFQPLVGEVKTQFAATQDSASEWLRNIGGQQNVRPPAGAFSSFEDSFGVTGPLNLTDTPEVLVYADQAPYLSAQSYDEYDGNGWTSTVEDTFQSKGPNGDEFYPEISFPPGQEIMLSPDVSQDRQPTSVGIKNLGPETTQMLSVDTFASSNKGVAVRMSWIQYDNVLIPLDSVDVNTLPPDFRGFTNYLLSVKLDGEDDGYGPLPANEQDAATLRDERQKLVDRFLTISWQADESGQVTQLIVTGQVPVYDDAVAVSRSSQESIESGATYVVESRTSVASGPTLAEAGTAYPDWVTQRYLPLPDTVSPRTLELARQIVEDADATNPYDQAKAIERYLWENLVYDPNVSAPPKGTDLVDYFLFETDRGYCTHYASAMAVMLRALGIPAKVVTGYFPGEYDEQQGGFLYRQKNAHAWVEVFFPGYGWIRFEPTSSQQLTDQGDEVAPNQSTPTPEATIPSQPDLGPVPTMPASTPITDQEILPPVTPVREDENAGGGGLSRTAIGLGIGSITVLVLVALMAARWLLPMRGLSVSAALYMRLRRIARLVGVRAGPFTTPSEVATSISRVIPAGREHVHTIVHNYELDQFGPDRSSPDLLNRASRGWNSLRKDIPRLLWKRLGRRKRGGASE